METTNNAHSSEQTYWYRSIDIESELHVLYLRNQNQSKQYEDRYRCPEDSNKEPYFTFLSCFHLLAQNVKQYLFAEPVGILLKNNQTREKIVWRNSGRTNVTDDIFKVYHSQEDFDKLMKDNQLIITNEKAAQELFFASFKNMCLRYQREGIPNPRIAWTEGLFRYKIDEIKGVVIQENDPEIGIALSCVFAKLTNKEKHLDLYFIKLEDGSFGRVSTKSLKYNKKKVSSLFHKYIALFK